MEDFNGEPNDHMMAVANHLNPQYNNASVNKSGGNDNNDVEFAVENDIDVNNAGGGNINNFDGHFDGMKDDEAFNGGGASL